MQLGITSGEGKETGGEDAGGLTSELLSADG
jgi:hypothetical protein